MIAEVVLNSNSRATDEIYHYEIPAAFENKVKIGVRVFVPFGKGNKKHEAFVVGFANTSEFAQLKEILEVCDEYSYFDENMVSLVKFMRHRYFCSYISAIKAIVPTGVGTKIIKYVSAAAVLPKGAEKYMCHSLKAGEIYEAVKKAPLTLEEISAMLGSKNVSATVRAMQKRGIVTIEEKTANGVHDSMEEWAELSVTFSEAIDAVCAMEKRAPARARCLEILAENFKMPVRELLEFAQTDKNVVKTLEAKGYLKIYKTVQRENIFENFEEISPKKHVLNTEQRAVADCVFESIQKREKNTFLLNGVTGSGKTEVYLDIIEKTVALGKQAVFLVPEISLTPQMIRRVTSRFGERVAVFHSSLTQKQRFDQWKRIKDNEADIVVGARSAVFAPFDNPGIFIIDEEHENTYKSELSPKYSTCEIARFRANLNSSVVLLASATPLVESTYKAKNGKYKFLELTKRANNASLPQTEIVDMREEMSEGNMSIFSRRLAEEIGKNLENKTQTILFLNRRGFSSFVSCRNCGFVVSCPNCNVSLTYHKSVDKMVCHYCDYVTDVPKKCPSCESKYIKYFGIGTQKVADELTKLFPTASVIRMDADTTAKRNSHEMLLNKFRNREADILVGTQMISKGLDFENVTLVGIIAADMSLNMDDYRASERTFDLITQVCGRAGRGEKEGMAIIQTYSPENETIQNAAMQDYDKFYVDEIELRKLLIYPPFCEFLNFVFTGENRYCAQNTANGFFEDMRKIAEEHSMVVYPVSQAPLFRINNKYRYRFMVKSRYSKVLYEKIGALIRKYQMMRGVSQISVDVNPTNMY